MHTFEQARKLVADRLENSNFSDKDSLIILDNFTIEKPYAWIFFYTSKLYHETKETQYAIAGNSPIIVDKETLEQTSYPTAYSLEEILQKYEEEKKIWNLILPESHLIENSKLISLKNKLELGLNIIKEIKDSKTFSLASGSEFRLKMLQYDLQNIGIDTSLILAWGNKPETL
ncbi:YrhB domain-containing protein [Flavobacterium sp. RS13.1]|uniref:YrhB domain-containing protein n=1 Tax=Flavobacterium sp. RS13.1 TaxID=3400345 RepID=UPI003AAE8B6F